MRCNFCTFFVFAGGKGDYAFVGAGVGGNWVAGVVFYR